MRAWSLTDLLWLVTGTGRRPAGAATRRNRSSATSRSTASSMPRSAAPRTTAGATICPGPKASAAGEAAEAALPRTPSRAASPSHQRPDVANRPSLPGHWEADLMLLPSMVKPSWQPTSARRVCSSSPAAKQSGRSHRRQPDRHARTAANPLRKTITFDNGTEFACHYRLKADLGMKTFFCDTLMPPGKKAASKTPSVECAGSCHEKPISPPSDPKSINASSHAYNHTPRKCLDFKTPAEVFLINCCTSNVNPPSAFAGMTKEE